jgi:hypothetical protein
MQQHGRGSLPPLTPYTLDTATTTSSSFGSKPPLVDSFTSGTPGSQMSLQDATPPLADPTPQEAETLLSGALYGCSTEDRDQALADVHGVTSAVAMDNEFIANRLAQLDQAISDCRSKSAYLRAKIQDPEYVSNRKFRLQFLMAENFQAQAAAERLVSFFESKLVLFGPEMLTSDLTLDDLGGEDIKGLEHGVVQRLLGKDHAGRVVVSCWPTTLQEPSILIQNKVNITVEDASETLWMGHTSIHDEAHDDFVAVTTSDQFLTRSSEPVTSWQLKALWYLVSTIVSEESQESQRNGFVLVIFGMGPRSQADRHSLWKLMYILRSLPTRVASVHFCYDDPEAKAIANLAVLALDRKSRARFRTHYGKFECSVPSNFANVHNTTSSLIYHPESFTFSSGSHDDVVAELSTFGIGSNLLTVDPRSEESAMVIREWFANRRLKEANERAAAATKKAAPSGGLVSDIGHYDVLFGTCKMRYSIHAD